MSPNISSEELDDLISELDIFGGQRVDTLRSALRDAEQGEEIDENEDEED